MKIRNYTALIAITAIALTSSVIAQDAGTPDKESIKKNYATEEPYSPYARGKYPTRVYWGDTHLHTSNSMDAGSFGARLTPRDAYRFAKGDIINSSTGQPVKLARPLDFLVVTDHSDGMGFFPMLYAGSSTIMANEQGKRWHNMIQTGQGADAALEIISAFSQGKIDKEIFPTPGTAEYSNTWQRIINAADEANKPGSFTAFIGFEWTSNTSGNNLHRNVILRDNGYKASLVAPFTTIKPLGSDNPRDLWKWMAAYQDKTNGQALAIAHNGNLSNGIMFPMVESFTGKKIDKEYAQNRERWEPLYEVTQIKGDGETHPLLSPNDEFANFETWDKGNLDLSAPKKDSMLEFEYARSALKNGLVLEKELGTNPYKFGLIGATDSHTGLATAEENNFFGKASNVEPGKERVEHVFIENPDTGLKIINWETSASGYAGVWATDNTREALFDAMKRKETYATTGPRMLVRFFGGWNYSQEDEKSRNPANIGYAKGVPMGGDLPPMPEQAEATNPIAPTFLVAALKDPIGANLDRVQIIKGWTDEAGKTHEKVYNVAWSDSDQRKLDQQGNLPAVGNTVDVKNATWTNTIGDPELIQVWQDPDFNPQQSAFYYVRVLEIPTPRWTAYDAKYYGTNIPKNSPTSIQERAYTSPIWYTPNN